MMFRDPDSPTTSEMSATASNRLVIMFVVLASAFAFGHIPDAEIVRLPSADGASHLSRMTSRIVG